MCRYDRVQALSRLVVIGTEAKLRIDKGEARSHCTPWMFSLKVVLRSRDRVTPTLLVFLLSETEDPNPIGCERYDVCASLSQGNEQWPGLTRRFVVLARRRDDDLQVVAVMMMVWP